MDSYLLYVAIGSSVPLKAQLKPSHKAVTAKARQHTSLVHTHPAEGEKRYMSLIAVIPFLITIIGITFKYCYCVDKICKAHLMTKSRLTDVATNQSREVKSAITLTSCGHGSRSHAPSPPPPRPSENSSMYVYPLNFLRVHQHI